jgi:predicted alpha/beta hydrolase family esterase
MKSAIIIHGLPSEKEYFNAQKPSPSNAHWLPWLQHQLNIHGMLAQTPEMPAPYSPDYHHWKEVFEYFPLTEQTDVVGYSLGGGFLLRWLSENPSAKLGKVALVASWLDTEQRMEGHFLKKHMGTEAFPELLQYLIAP